MPINNNLSASDYTAQVKAQAAAYAYRSGSFPTRIQTSDQPYISRSALNAQLLASEASLATTYNGTVITGANYVRPFVGRGYVNQSKKLSTVGFQGMGVTGSSSKLVGGVPANGKVGTYSLEGALRIAGGGTQGVYSAGRGALSSTPGTGQTISGGAF